MKAILKNTLNGKCIEVNASTSHSDSSYGKAVWVDKHNMAYCQVGMQNPFYHIIPLEDNLSACQTAEGKLFVAGFGTWDEAENFAAHHGLQLTVFVRKDGHEWKEKETAYAPFNIRDTYFSMDDQPQFYSRTELAELEDNFDGYFSGLDEDSDNYQAQAEELNGKKEKAVKALSGMGDSQLLLLFPDLSFRLDKAEQMEVHHDGESWIIGAAVE